MEYAKLFLLIGKFVGESKVLPWYVESSDDKPHSQDDERNAEELTLIDAPLHSHIDFPRLLHILNVFNQKSGAKDAEHKHSENEALPLLRVALPVKPHTQGKHSQIA